MKSQRSYSSFEKERRVNMITFTLRLQDIESEALDRLAYVYGMSKNRLINTLIAQEYNNFLSSARTVAGTPDEELFSISHAQGFPREFLEACGGDVREMQKPELKILIKCCDYAIENEEEELTFRDVDQLSALREEAVEAFRTK